MKNSIITVTEEEKKLVAGAISQTERHLAASATAWALLMGAYGVPTVGFVVATLAVPASFALVDATDKGSLHGIGKSFAKKLNVASTNCLLLGGILKGFFQNTHITTNVFSGFNITNS